MSEWTVPCSVLLAAKRWGSLIAGAISAVLYRTDCHPCNRSQWTRLDRVLWYCDSMQVLLTTHCVQSIAIKVLSSGDDRSNDDEVDWNWLQCNSPNTELVHQRKNISHCLLARRRVASSRCKYRTELSRINLACLVRFGNLCKFDWSSQTALSVHLQLPYLKLSQFCYGKHGLFNSIVGPCLRKRGYFD